MASRGRPKRINCVNCNVCINKLRRYLALELESNVSAKICSWVDPKIIMEDDYVCEACRDLAISSLNTNLHTEVPLKAGSSTKGHTNICVLCGCSIAKRQSDKLVRYNPTEMQTKIIDIIKSRVEPREISESDRACHACWLQAKREVVRMNQKDERRPELETTDVQQDSIIEPEPVIQAKPILKEEIVLPDYRRAANSTHTCVFPHCTSTSFHNISDKLRAKVLHKHNYYLPKLARACSEHLSNNMWDTLFNSENSIETFTVNQIQHVFSLVNVFNPILDFENIEEMDEKVFKHWMGVTKEEFDVLLEEIPRISELRKGKLGLAALLLKMRTGDSGDRISSLVNMPRRTLEGLMGKVREILSQEVSATGEQNKVTALP